MRERTAMPNQLKFEQWVPFPLDRVFAFFSDPQNLPRLMPAASDTRIDQLTRVPPSFAPLAGEGTGGAAGVGSTIITSFRLFPLLPFRAQWIARITEFEWNHHFADVQDKGPFKRWHHRHEFTAETRNGVKGTLVRDAIDYKVGFGPLGRIANALFVRRQMENTFSQRQDLLPTLLS
jgi:ligand-binding SRPBCC domain-containing protein